MTEITLNTKPEAVNYTTSVDQLKAAMKPHAKSSGDNMTISYKEGSEEAVKSYASDIGKLFANGEVSENALQTNPVLQKKLSDLLDCKPEALPRMLSDLNKSVEDFPKLLGGLLAASEDPAFQKMTERMVSVSESSRHIVTDQDMRELLKLLIMAFAQLMTSQRESDLYNLNNMMQAFGSKLSAMETAKDKQYDAAMTTAITSIVCGVVTLGATIGGTVMQASALGQAGTGKIEDNAKLQNLFRTGEAVTAGGKSLGEMGTGIGGAVSASQSRDKAEADIRATAQDQLAEVVRKAQEQNQTTTKALMEYMSSLVAMLQQLIQNTRQAETGIVQA